MIWFFFFDKWEKKEDLQSNFWISKLVTRPLASHYYVWLRRASSVRSASVPFEMTAVPVSSFVDRRTHRRYIINSLFQFYSQFFSIVLSLAFQGRPVWREPTQSTKFCASNESRDNWLSRDEKEVFHNILQGCVFPCFSPVSSLN